MCLFGIMHMKSRTPTGVRLADDEGERLEAILITGQSVRELARHPVVIIQLVEIEEIRGWVVRLLRRMCELLVWQLLLRRGRGHATQLSRGRATPEDHWNRVLRQGDRRPMTDHPQAMSDLRSLLAAREPLYASAAHTIDTSGRPVDRIVEEIAGLARD